MKEERQPPHKTLASNASSIDRSKPAVEMKVAIEQMREQEQSPKQGFKGCNATLIHPPKPTAFSLADLRCPVRRRERRPSPLVW